jgi:hypothetical protein
MGMRACVLIPLGAWLNDGMAVFAMACMQPFTHNGMYYYWRKKVDGVYGHWFDQSKTSRAILTTIMTPLHRTILMAVGLAVFILTALDLINTDF